jgi:hypothetical protein
MRECLFSLLYGIFVWFGHSFKGETIRILVLRMVSYLLMFENHTQLGIFSRTHVYGSHSFAI